MLICERPWSSQRVAMLARKDGEYTRPILGHFVDIRIEDFVPQDILVENFALNVIGKLPDVPEHNQLGRYFISHFNTIDEVNLTETDVEKFLATGEYILLPHTPRSPLWQYSNSPWWEYAVVLDQYQQFIKAPKRPREAEPDPSSIDERLDDFEENAGKLNVLSPVTLEFWRVSGVTESYLRRLDRI